MKTRIFYWLHPNEHEREEMDEIKPKLFELLEAVEADPGSMLVINFSRKWVSMNDIEGRVIAINERNPGNGLKIRMFRGDRSNGGFPDYEQIENFRAEVNEYYETQLDECDFNVFGVRTTICIATLVGAFLTGYGCSTGQVISISGISSKDYICDLERPVQPDRDKIRIIKELTLPVEKKVKIYGWDFKNYFKMDTTPLETILSEMKK